MQIVNFKDIGGIFLFHDLKEQSEKKPTKEMVKMGKKYGKACQVGPIGWGKNWGVGKNGFQTRP
jgi:hypothetical protein